MGQSKVNISSRGISSCFRILILAFGLFFSLSLSGQDSLPETLPFLYFEEHSLEKVNPEVVDEWAAKVREQNLILVLTGRVTQNEELILAQSRAVNVVRLLMEKGVAKEKLNLAVLSNQQLVLSGEEMEKYCREFPQKEGDCSKGVVTAVLKKP